MRAAADNRLFVEAVLYRNRAGIPWWTAPEINAIVDVVGKAMALSPGQRADITEAEPLLDEVDPEAFIGDKAYDADPLIEKLEERQITSVLLSRKITFQLYKKRNEIEWFFARLEQFRGIATRYDKLKSIFLAAVLLVSTIIGIN